MNIKTLLANPSATMRMAWLYASSLIRSRNFTAETADLTSFCLFIGYPRTGHTLVSSIIDAHSEAVISRRPATVGLIPHFSGAQIIEISLRNSRKTATTPVRQGVYEYSIPDQWQGTYRKLKVVGNRNAPVTLEALSRSPKLYGELQRKIGTEIRFIHVVRNPFDTISRIEKQNKLTFEEAAVWFSTMCSQFTAFLSSLPDNNPLVHTIYLEDLIASPQSEISKMLNFLNLNTDEKYLDACASIIWSKPSQARKTREWSKADRDMVNSISQEFDYLSRYIN
jgi:hypothetical protein